MAEGTSYPTDDHISADAPAEEEPSEETDTPKDEGSESDSDGVPGS